LNPSFYNLHHLYFTIQPKIHFIIYINLDLDSNEALDDSYQYIAPSTSLIPISLNMDDQCYKFPNEQEDINDKMNFWLNGKV